MLQKSRVFIGTSGWNYKHWRHVFYPPELTTSRWLDYYVHYFDTVEINNTFYQLPARSVFENWRTATPDNFVFVVKANRFITHMKKLADPELTVANFLANASGLKEKLGLVLFQLPPFWKVNLPRLENLVKWLTSQKIIAGTKFALEIRHPTWNCQDVFQVLKNDNVALCFADWPDLVIDEPVTADFIYLRRHGPASLYASCYTQEQLNQDARRIKNWLEQGRNVYVYYNNDAYGWAVNNALTLKKMIAGQ